MGKGQFEWELKRPTVSFRRLPAHADRTPISVHLSLIDRSVETRTRVKVRAGAAQNLSLPLAEDFPSTFVPP